MTVTAVTTLLPWSTNVPLDVWLLSLAFWLALCRPFLMCPFHNLLLNIIQELISLTLHVSLILLGCTYFYSESVANLSTWLVLLSRFGTVSGIHTFHLPQVAFFNPCWVKKTTNLGIELNSACIHKKETKDNCRDKVTAGNKSSRCWASSQKGSGNYGKLNDWRTAGII